MNLIVIENKSKKKEFNEAMYRFIEINSIFNIFFCSIMLLKLINTCIFNQAGIFCSSMYEMPSSQYFKIVTVHFMGNTFKLCSNVSYLLFALNRLIIINSSKNLIKSTAKKASSIVRKQTHRNYLRFSLIFLVIFLSCSCLSLFKLFQYRLNDEKDYRRDFPYEFRDELFCNSSLEYKSECKLFSAFKLANSLLNDVCMIFLNVCIDVILIRKFRNYLDKKSVHVVDVDHHKNIETTKKRLNRMVFCNCFLYIISHLPEFIVTLSLILFSGRIAKFCKFNFSCDLLNEEAEFFGLISMVCQFYIYKVFDKNFRASFEHLKEAILKFF